MEFVGDSRDGGGENVDVEAGEEESEHQGEEDEEEFGSFWVIGLCCFLACNNGGGLDFF